VGRERNSKQGSVGSGSSWVQGLLILNFASSLKPSCSSDKQDRPGRPSPGYDEQTKDVTGSKTQPKISPKNWLRVFEIVARRQAEYHS